MGSTSSLMTITEAANRLGRSKRSIHNYINKGFIRRKSVDGDVVVHREDVEQLAEELGTDFPALNRRTLFEINNRLRKLEEEMATVKQVWSSLGLQENPLRPDAKEAAALHKAATDYLSVDTYQWKELESWSGLFLQIDERVIEKVGEVTSSHQPWHPFLTLASRMVEFVGKAKGIKTDISLQSLRAKLEMGRKRVREAALLWVEAGKGTVPAHLFKALDSDKESLLRSLSNSR